VVNGRVFELVVLGVYGGEPGFSFVFYSKAAPTPQDGLRLIERLDRLTGNRVEDVRVRRNERAGDSGPARGAYPDMNVEVGDVECLSVFQVTPRVLLRPGMDPYQCSLATRRSSGDMQ
jgi:hypothetical protein